jgi:NADH-quinone oxidoreductase subunit E
MDMTKVKTIIDSYKGDKTAILPILQDIQAELNYLPREAMLLVAKKLEVSLSSVSSMATFFSSFSLTPRGEHIVTVCMGTACHVRGAPRVLSEIERELKVSDGETTPDKKYTIETVNCVGACALGPLVMIDGNYHGNIATSDVEEMLEEYSDTSKKEG